MNWPCGVTHCVNFYDRRVWSFAVVSLELYRAFRIRSAKLEMLLYEPPLIKHAVSRYDRLSTFTSLRALQCFKTLYYNVRYQILWNTCTLNPHRWRTLLLHHDQCYFCTTYKPGLRIYLISHHLTTSCGHKKGRSTGKNRRQKNSRREPSSPLNAYKEITQKGSKFSSRHARRCTHNDRGHFEQQSNITEYWLRLISLIKTDVFIPCCNVT